MDRPQVEALLAAVPKAELHLHLEGAIEPETAVELAARHGQALAREVVAARYVFRDFRGFLEAFKWVTSYLRAPADYALLVERLADQLIRQNVVYAEVTLSVGVMLRREQDVEANFAAIRQAAAQAGIRGLRLQWVFDATRQFGAAAAMKVAQLAAQMKNDGVVAFGMGGDELSVPAEEFRGVYEFAADQGLHRLVHAGEIGPPETVREAVELLGAERIGHGIAGIRHERTMDFLVSRQIPLEICPTSNLRTGALARQLGLYEALPTDHPLRQLFARGLGVTLSTDDPAMFHTDLLGEYGLGLDLGLGPAELVRIAEMGFEFAFLPTQEKQAFLQSLRAKTNALRLI